MLTPSVCLALDSLYPYVFNNITVILFSQEVKAGFLEKTVQYGHFFNVKMGQIGILRLCIFD